MFYLVGAISTVEISYNRWPPQQMCCGGQYYKTFILDKIIQETIYPNRYDHYKSFKSFTLW